MYRDDLENDVFCILNDVKSEIECREGRLFDGELCDAIRYLEDAISILEQLDSDDYADADRYGDEDE